MNREERRELAEKHFKYMAENFEDEIDESIHHTQVFTRNFEFEKKNEGKNPSIKVINSTSENAIKECGKECCVLNFASFIHPGGGFIKGSIAQEEALCHASSLYNVLLPFKWIYDENFNDKSRMNNGLYENFALYSPNVTFVYGEEIINADVLTCAAPNATRFFEKGEDVRKERRYGTALRERIEFILKIADQRNVKTLILGAFGCGVFGNDPYLVSNVFRNLLTDNKFHFDEVIFAIPKGKDNNLEAFEKTFS